MGDLFNGKVYYVHKEAKTLDNRCRLLINYGFQWSDTRWVGHGYTTLYVDKYDLSYPTPLPE